MKRKKFIIANDNTYIYNLIKEENEENKDKGNLKKSTAPKVNVEVEKDKKNQESVRKKSEDKLLLLLKSQVSKIRNYQKKFIQEKPETSSLHKVLLKKHFVSKDSQSSKNSNIEFDIPNIKKIYTHFYDYREKNNKRKYNKKVPISKLLANNFSMEKESWISYLNEEDISDLRKLFLFFDEILIKLPEESINNLIFSNLYKKYIKIISLLKKTEI